MDKNPLFSTFDIPLIAYLLTKSHEYVKTERDESRRLCFYFPSTPELQQDVFAHSNNALIPVQDYYRSLTRIWRMIKNEGGGR